MTGRTLGVYTILEKLGEGGMGVVYKARHERLRRLVAIKVLAAECMADPDRRRRFVQEAQAASALNHPAIVTIHDICCEQGVDFIVMELVEGRPLDRVIPPHGLPAGDARRYALAIADPLERAHAAGIVHRDLKPANIMVTGAAAVKLLDFGLAKLTGAAARAGATVTMEGIVAGTPAYMSPEQAEGRPVDPRSDIFTFGVVLYQMLTGKLPFVGGSTASIVAAVLRDEPAPPAAAPPDLAAVTLRCLRKDPDGRFQSMAEVRQALSARAAAPVERPPSIAVLPFENLSAEQDAEYFSDGLAEEILNALATIPGLRVAARTSAFSFRGREADTTAIGAALQVDHLLTGSVRRAGNRVRVSAQLVKVADGFQLWSERYHRELTDIFAIQDEIAQAIAGTLRVKLSGERLAPRPAAAIDAYNLYLKGHHARLQRTREGQEKAREYYQQAIEIDPAFALAHAGIGMYYLGLGIYGWLPPRQVLPAARLAVEKALQLDPLLAEAHRVQGIIRAWHDFDWSGAEQSFRRALELEPSSAMTHYVYAFCLLSPLRRLEEAVAAMTRALELDPLAISRHADFAMIYIQQRRFDLAGAQCRKALDTDPANAYASFALGWSRVAAGKALDAIPLLEKAVENSGRVPFMVGGLGSAYALAGRAAGARRMLAELESQTRHRYVPPGTFAWIHGALRDTEAAFAHLDRAIDDRDTASVQWLPTEPLFDRLRSDPRFAALLQKLRLQ